MRAFAIPISASLFADDVSLLYFPCLLALVVPSLLQAALPAVLVVRRVLVVLVVSKGFQVVLVVGADLVHLPANFQVARADLLYVQVMANFVLHNLPIKLSPVALSYLPMLAASQAP